MNTGRGKGKKLQLNRETVRLLAGEKLSEVVGGASLACAGGTVFCTLNLACNNRLTQFNPCQSKACPSDVTVCGPCETTGP